MLRPWPKSQQRLESLEREVGVLQLGSSIKAVEWLELFNRIAFDRGTQALANDVIKIDEDTGPQEAIDLVHANAMSPRKALDRRRFVRSVMINVHAGIASPALHNHCDELLERLLLLDLIQGPYGLIYRRCPGIL